MEEITLRDGKVTTAKAVREYFEYLFGAEESGDEFPVNFEFDWPLVYSLKSHAKRALVESDQYFEGIDYLLTKNGEPSEKADKSVRQGWNREDIFLSVSCFEYFVARKVRPIFEIYRQCRIAATKAAKAKSSLPYHLRRYLVNHDRIPIGYFSTLQEITTKLIAPLEIQGYNLPDRLVPDISLGLLFCKYLREEKGIDTNALQTYQHSYEDGRVVEAKLYPVDLLSDFVKLLQNEWIANRAHKYFKERDVSALEYLPKILKAPSQ